MRPIFAISPRNHIQEQISPDQRELRQPNFHRWLGHRSRFRKCKEIPDIAGYVGGKTRENRKNREIPILWRPWGKSLQGCGPGVSRFCMQASLLMYASNIVCLCCTVRTARRCRPGYYRKIPPPPSAKYCKIPQF